mmetsp:Transcript_30500/g.64260  ORF Transcript_30500/g.64260 Transcript_30500/m.64260 type:complete len:218 (-) Transcript_30500:1277-1930(-)
MISNENIMNCLAVILNAIEQRDWTTFQNIALKDSAVFRLMANIVANNPDFNGMTLLHAVVRYDPPLELVFNMILACREIAAARDCIGRTPLHVAAGTQASPSLIKLLVQACPESCEVQDDDGRTPLHLACDNSCQLFEDDFMQSRPPPSYDVIRYLLQGSLKAAALEDEDETSALEYAIISGAPIKVVKLLQKATQKQAKGECAIINTRQVRHAAVA